MLFLRGCRDALCPYPLYHHRRYIYNGCSDRRLLAPDTLKWACYVLILLTLMFGTHWGAFVRGQLLQYGIDLCLILAFGTRGTYGTHCGGVLLLSMFSLIFLITVIT